MDCRFNSYTQQLCINDAVEQDPERGNSDTELQSVSRSTGPGQNVVWVSKFVDSVAEVTSAMNVSGMTNLEPSGNRIRTKVYQGPLRSKRMGILIAHLEVRSNQLQLKSGTDELQLLLVWKT